MRSTNRMKIAGKVEIDILHRHHLRITAACRTSLHPKTWTQAGLTQADRCIFPNPVQTITQSNAGCRFALTRRCWRDSRNEHEFPIRSSLKRLYEIVTDLGLGVPIGL